MQQLVEATMEVIVDEVGYFFYIALGRFREAERGFQDGDNQTTTILEARHTGTRPHQYRSMPVR